MGVRAGSGSSSGELSNQSPVSRGARGARSDRVVSAATSAPERTTLATLAPVRSVAATTNRKTARMCAPTVPSSVEAAQNSASPTMPPRTSKISGRQNAPCGLPGPSPSVPAPSASSRAANSTIPPALNGRDAGITGRSTSRPPTRAKTSGAAHLSTPNAQASPRVSPAPIAPASQPSHSGKATKTASATRPSPTRSRWRCSTTGRRGIAVAAERRARGRLGARSLAASRPGAPRAPVGADGSLSTVERFFGAGVRVVAMPGRDSTRGSEALHGGFITGAYRGLP